VRVLSIHREEDKPMRELDALELTQVTGAGGSYCQPVSCYPQPPSCPPAPRQKGNNGFGNGGNDGVPGNSGKTDVNR
jgi:hypothetical protein